jgi:hypothetical protein
VFWLAMMPLSAAAQVEIDPTGLPTDSLSTIAPVTLPGDSFLAPDTSATPTSVDTTISYSAGSIEFIVGSRFMRLRGAATISYKNMNLRAEEILVDWDSGRVVAQGQHDTLWVDSLHCEIDTVIITGDPVFIEGDQQMQGTEMTYDLKTRKGRVTEGSTTFADGYYQGAVLKKVSTDVLYAGYANYTTCDLPQPHYTFYSKKMKLIIGDRVIAEPVVLYFERIPVFIIPFAIFPSRSGRQSGLIIPTYGESSVQGRFLHHLGYYWALNDYTDFQGTMDYYEKSGFLFHGAARYNWRYHLSGSVSGAITRQHFETLRRRWELHVNHDQTIDPDTRLTVRGDFLSDRNYYQQYSFNLNQQLQQTLRSDATLTHTFPSGKNSYSANLHHDQNLVNDVITEEIPRVTFRRGQSAIIPAPKSVPGDTAKPENRWYNNINYSYTGEYLHRRVVNHVDNDLTLPLEYERRSAARHTLNFNGAQTISYFSLQPSLAVNEHWVGEYMDYTNSLAGVRVSDFRTRHTFSTALGFSSKVYGYWTNPIAGVDAIRQVITPTFSFSFQPDFSDPEWGYFQQVTDTNGVTLRKDRFAGSLFGGTPTGKSFALNMSLANQFQMKYGRGEEKDKKKIDLFTLNLGTSYNFAADSLNFAPLTSSFRASPLSGSQPLGPLKTLAFDVTATHSFYKNKSGTTSLVNQYYWDPGNGRILRLTNFAISADAGLALGTLVHPPEQTQFDSDSLDVIGSGVSVPGDTSQPGFSQTPKPSLPINWYLGQIPFNLQLSFYYNISRANPNDPSETFWMNASVDASLTPNWQISYNTRVSLLTRQVESAGITIYRDMHCWEARLIWNPLGISSGYFLRINIKSPQLQDVKVERRRNQGSFMGFE